jgi:hypothetical protein
MAPARGSRRAGGTIHHGAQAERRRPLRLSRAPGPGAPAQRRPVRMGRLKVLVRVDLPVDVVVVLECKERAGQAQGTERTLCKR